MFVFSTALPDEVDNVLREGLFMLGHVFQNPERSSYKFRVDIFHEDELQDLVLDYKL